MLIQINVVNEKLVKEVKVFNPVTCENDMKVVENELKNHESFSSIVVDFANLAMEISELRKWLEKLKKKDEVLHNKMILVPLGNQSAEAK